MRGVRKKKTRETENQNKQKATNNMADLSPNIVIITVSVIMVEF